MHKNKKRENKHTEQTQRDDCFTSFLLQRASFIVAINQEILWIKVKGWKCAYYVCHWEFYLICGGLAGEIATERMRHDIS